MSKFLFHIFKFYLLSFFLILQVYASSPGDNELRILLKAPDMQSIIQRGTLVVAMLEKDNPPFFMVDEKGNLIGHDVELAKTIARLLHVKVEFNRNNPTFDDVVFMVARGEADVGISKLSLTLSRAQLVLYTDPYLILHKALLINRVGLTKFGSSLSTRNLFKTKAAVIGAIDQSSYEDFAQYLFPNASHFTAPSWENDIIPKVMKGEILGAFRDELVVRNTMLSVSNASIYLLAVIIEDEPDPIMMVVNKRSYVLQQFLNLFLEYYYPKKNLEEIINKYKSYMYKKAKTP
jgi:polar amino acid transport system substrate-binding protein